ncbi:hypothetical protein L1987_54648 [Smallanthus sonchifolius]|uniref:Uncharacterized protein n=1 Tax=Smallanthus sonchifolius TaxID=185202 RepID=A0ACB9E8S7_9ASTR|nr:hypothetical protein L1987_54648 [Smallanthus sonchifolius]
MVALTMSLEYNSSKMVFEEFKSNLKGGNKDVFLMYPRFAALPYEEIDESVVQVQAEVAEEQLLPVQDPIVPDLEDAEVISSSDDEGTPERPPVPINREAYRAEKAKGKSLIDSSTPAPIDPHVLVNNPLLVQAMIKNDQGGGDDGGNDQGGNQDDTQGSDPFNFEFEGDLTDPKDNDFFSQHLESNQAKDIQDYRVESSSDLEMERRNQDIDDEVHIPRSTTNMLADGNTRNQKELPSWRLPPGPPSESHVTINIKSYYSKRVDRSGIASWAFDSEKNLYVVKRKSGRLEYYKRANDFSSLTKLDLQQLNEAYFENRGRNGPAEMYRTFLNEQCLT